ncbi:hypothetical protein LUU34_01413800 [Aix galericulata]|nr:hypothetical protein LUU34_01413800 [Aix galericulata]
MPRGAAPRGARGRAAHRGPGGERCARGVRSCGSRCGSRVRIGGTGSVPGRRRRIGSALLQLCSEGGGTGPPAAAPSSPQRAPRRRCHSSRSRSRSRSAEHHGHIAAEERRKVGHPLLVSPLPHTSPSFFPLPLNPGSSPPPRRRGEGRPAAGKAPGAGVSRWFAACAGGTGKSSAPPTTLLQPA